MLANSYKHVEDVLNGTTLSPRERQITHLFVRGHDTARIMQQLDLQPGTFNTHKRSIFSKLGVRRQVELVSLILSTALRKAEARHAAARKRAAGAKPKKDGDEVKD